MQLAITEIGTAWRRLLGGGSFLSAVGILVLMLAACADAIARAAFNHPVGGVIEGSPILLVVCTFLALAHAQRVGAHVTFSLVTDRLRPRAAAAVEGIAYLAAVVVLAFAARASWDPMVRSIEAHETAIGLTSIAMWPARVAIVVGFTMLAAELLRQSALQLRVAAMGATVHRPS